MRWKVNKIVKKIVIGKKPPNIGDTKEKIKFALLPEKIDITNDITNIVWLERYIEVYEYRKFMVRKYQYPNERHFDHFLYDEIETHDWKFKERKFYII